MYEPEMKIEPARIRHLREQRAWSQEQLAHIAGLNVRTLQRVEANGTASLETWMALASALEVTAADLLATPVTDAPSGGNGNGGQRMQRAAHYGLLATLVFVLALILVQRMGTSSGAANKSRTAAALNSPG